MPKRKCESGTFRWFGILAALVCLGAPRAADAKTWTDAKGSKIVATYERVQGDDVVLKRGFEIVKLPLANLGTEDFEFVQQKLKASGSHIWRDLKGRQIVARPQRMLDGKIELKLKDQTVAVPFGQLTYEDQEFVRDWLAGRNESALLPKPEEGSRVWTDETGRKVMAHVGSVEQGGIVQLRSYGVDIPIAFGKLSEGDQEHLRKQLEAEGKEDLLPRRPVRLTERTSPRPSRRSVVEPDQQPLRPSVTAQPQQQPLRPQVPRQSQRQSDGDYSPSDEGDSIDDGQLCRQCGRRVREGAELCDSCRKRQRPKVIAEQPMPQPTYTTPTVMQNEQPVWKRYQHFLGLLPLAGFLFGWLFLRRN